MSLWETARRQCCVRWGGGDNGYAEPAESAGVNQTISRLLSDRFIWTASRREIISAGQNKPGPISVVGGARGGIHRLSFGTTMGCFVPHPGTNAPCWPAICLNMLLRRCRGHPCTMESSSLLCTLLQQRQELR